MIVIKKWSATKRRRNGWFRYNYTGWFVLGLLPVLIVREGCAP